MNPAILNPNYRARGLLCPLDGGTQDLALTRYLSKDDHPKFCRIGLGIEVNINLLGEFFPDLNFPDFRETLHDCNVSEMTAAIFTPQNLRFRVIQRNHKVDIGLVLFTRLRQSLGLDMCAKPVRTVHGDTRNVHCNLLYFQCLLDGLSRELRIVATEFCHPINNHLWSVDAVQTEAPRVSALAIAEEA